MDWKHQTEILHKYTNEFIVKLNNFNKCTNMIEICNKFNTINKQNLSVNYFDIFTNLNNTNIDKLNNNEIESTNNTIENIIGIKIKRKHLLKKIHPDKIYFSIEKIKKQRNDETNLTFNYEDETNKIILCTTKIISDKLNILDSFELLYKNTILFDDICNELKIEKEQIKKLKLFMDKKNIVGVNNFASLFSGELCFFISMFNYFNEIKSVDGQIKIYFNSIYLNIITYLDNNIFNKIHDKYTEYDNMKFNLNYNDKITKEQLEMFFCNDKITKEQLEMFYEDNIRYLHFLENTNDIQIFQLIEIFKEDNIEFYDNMKQLEKNLPILYESICNLKIEKYGEKYFYFGKLDNLTLNMIASNEYNRIAYKV